MCLAPRDHFNSEVVGDYVSTDGSRVAALEPVSRDITARFGGIEARGRTRFHRARR
jgi:hypothetical protein